MCGRFWLTKKVPGLENLLNQEQINELNESYNIAPGQWTTVIVEQDQINLKTMKWGLIPSWSKTPSSAYKMINARAETINEKVSYKKLLSHHRCLVPCSGFYEWHQQGRIKQPYAIKFHNNETNTLAGLWTTWQSPTVQEIQSFTIITTEANQLLKKIHDRMPVIISPAHRQAWLSEPDNHEALSLLQPYSAQEMEMYKISTYVNTPKNNDEQCLTPLK